MTRKRGNKPKERSEGDLLVNLSQSHGWVFLPKPKVSMMFDRKAKCLEACYEYRVVVPAKSALIALIPPKHSKRQP